MVWYKMFEILLLDLTKEFRCKINPFIEEVIIDQSCRGLCGWHFNGQYR